MSATDCFKFSQEEIFKTAFENLPPSDGKTKNLIDCKDNIIFVWDSKRKILLAQNVKILNKNVTVYQELHPTEPPILDVHFIRVNSSLTYAVLWGPTGVMVMAIPSRWGSPSGFQGGKRVVLTRCMSVDTKFLTLRGVEVCQVRFHPGSPQDNHIVVLTSQNMLRVFKLPPNWSIDEVALEPELVNVWNLSLNPVPGKIWNLSIMTTLGDTAVDFDFALSYVADVTKSEDEPSLEDIIWPIVVLRGNGDICILDSSVVSNDKIKFEGPLPMFPPADDNYGVEACSIVALHTVPPIIVVVTSSGTLYHSALLIPSSDEESSSSTSHILMVFQCIELELGIQLNDDDSSYSCPVMLHKDPVSRCKYYATHNAGLHAVSVTYAFHLEKFLDDPSPALVKDVLSTVEYLVCTRTNATPVLPVLGLCIIDSANVIVALLADGSVVSLPLKRTEAIANRSLLSEEVVNNEMTPIKKLLWEPFDSHIQNLLKRSVNQPLLKLDEKVNLSPQESLNLMSRTTNVLRQEYFAKFQLVRDEIEQRVMALKALRDLHENELRDLEKEKVSLQQMAEKLAEKFEEVKDKQQILNERIEKVVSGVLQLEPIESLAEKKMKNNLISIEEKIEKFEKSIKELKKELNYQNYKKSERKQEKNKKIQLGSKQMEMIKTSLNKTSQEIGDLVKVINSIKDRLNIRDE